MEAIQQYTALSSDQRPANNNIVTWDCPQQHLWTRNQTTQLSSIHQEFLPTTPGETTGGGSCKPRLARVSVHQMSKPDKQIQLFLLKRTDPNSNRRCPLEDLKPIFSGLLPDFLQVCGVQCPLSAVVVVVEPMLLLTHGVSKGEHGTLF